MKSRHEIRLGHATSSAKRRRLSNDHMYARDNIKTKTCRFCRGAGHTINHCPKIEEYGSPPVKTTAARDNLAFNLHKPGYFVSIEDLGTEKRPVAETFPKGTKGIVIHAKKRKGPGIYHYDVTVLCERGDPHPTYIHYPFSKAAVTRFINRSLASIVINQLTIAETNNSPPVFESVDMSQNGLVGNLSQSSTSHYPAFAQLPSAGVAQYSQSSSTAGFLDKMGFGDGVGDI